MSNLKPIGNRVLVQMDEAAETTKGGIVIVSTVEANKPQTGTVLAVGDEAKFVSVGDKILFNRLAVEARTIELNDQKYLLIEDEYVMAIIQ